MVEDTVTAFPALFFASAVSVYLPALVKATVPPSIVRVPVISLLFVVRPRIPSFVTDQSTDTIFFWLVCTAICALVLATAGRPKSNAGPVAVFVPDGVVELGLTIVEGFVVDAGLDVGVTVGMVGRFCSIGADVAVGVTVALGPVGRSGSVMGVLVGVGTGVGVGNEVDVAVTIGVGIAAASSTACFCFLALQDTTKMAISTTRTRQPTPRASSFVFLSILRFLSNNRMSRPGWSGSVNRWITSASCG